MKFLDKFRSYSSAKQIAIAVLFSHILVLIGLTCHHLLNFRSFPKKPIAVHTRILSQSQPQKSSKSPPSRPQTSQTPSPKPLKKSPSLAKSPSKSAIHETKKTPQKNERIAPQKPHSEVLLKEIESSLDSLTAHAEAIPKSSLSIPALVESKAEVIPEISSDLNPGYAEEIILYLQQALDLPERGEVKAKITIDSSGRLTSCEILNAKNKKNGEFLKKRLPELTFPCFNDFALVETSLDFTITFRNVENH